VFILAGFHSTLVFPVLNEIDASAATSENAGATGVAGPVEVSLLFYEVG
jgi:hypothetical protein